MKNRNIVITTILFALGAIAFSHRAQAVSPPPDGGYPGGNTAEGQNALLSLSNGTYNTAVGLFSLLSNTGGQFNTAVGAGALLANVGDSSSGDGTENTATGAGALLSNSTGTFNSACGTFALFSNVDGGSNNALGDSALRMNIHANDNTAIGDAALLSNDETGNSLAISNTAVGSEAMLLNTDGDSNTAVGALALQFNTTGFSNSAIGAFALQSNTTGNFNVALGNGAGGAVVTAENVICIGADVPGADVSNTCFIGNIFGVTSTGGLPVFVNGFGQLGTNTSSRRFKEEIKPMDRLSEALFLLKPVSFRYKKEIDPAGTSQLGLVAEDVEKVNPALVVRDKEGKPYSVRYEQVNAMLLNEFLKEHRKVDEQASEIEEQKATISELKKGMKTVVEHLKEQDSKIQRVSDQLKLSKPSPQTVTVNNNQ